MATLGTRPHSGDYNGLITTSILAGSLIVLCSIGHDLLRRKRRMPPGKGVADSSEQFSMGYFYQARVFMGRRPAPKFTTWPFVWIWDIALTPETTFLESSGVDSAAYIRWLRACFYYLLLHQCTTLPILLTIHLVFAPGAVSAANISRASVVSLVETARGRSLLWLHVVGLWYMMATWIGALYWLGKGILRHRRTALREELEDMAEKSGRNEANGAKYYDPCRSKEPSDKEPELHATDSDAAWRFRTVMIQNIPADMRSDSAIRSYLNDHLDAVSKGEAGGWLSKPNQIRSRCAGYLEKWFQPGNPNAAIRLTSGNGREIPSAEKCRVTTVVLVRKATELEDLCRRRDQALEELEKAHVVLAQQIIKAVDQTSAGSKAKESKSSASAPSDSAKAKLRPFVPFRRQTNSSLWEALADLEPTDLDSSQPLSRLRSQLFRGQSVPTIDLLLTRVNFLSLLIEDHRAHPESIAAASTAFVTFNRVADAQLACKRLPTHPSRTFSCKLFPAPDYRDILWDKVRLTSFSGDILRASIVHAVVWAATILWIIPVSLFVGLFSIDRIAGHSTAISRYLDRHEKQRALLQSLIPSSLVAIIALFVPTLIGQLSARGQRFITTSQLRDVVLSRYWVWSLCNVLIFFVLGLTAISSVIDYISTPTDLFDTLATSFPSAATFYVGWLILTTALHNFTELIGAGIPLFNQIAVTKAQTPRRRMLESQPRAFSLFYWAPVHLTVMAILLVFGLVNPVIIPFGLIYISVALVIFKNQHRHVYFRRWGRIMGGTSCCIRLSRYSLDALLLAEVVLIAFLFFTKQRRLGGSCIPCTIITVGFKLASTRWFEYHADLLDAEQANIYRTAPPPPKRMSKEMGPCFSGSDLSSPLATRESLRRLSVDTKKTVSLGDDPIPLIEPVRRLKWDDRPNFSTRYDDPLFTISLEDVLWLPRNPLETLTLDDTILYTGPALTSSEGGSGKIGQADLTDSPEVEGEDVEHESYFMLTKPTEEKPALTSSPDRLSSLGGERVSSPESMRSGSALTGTNPFRQSMSASTRGSQISSRTLLSNRQGSAHGERIRVADGVAERVKMEDRSSSSDSPIRSNFWRAMSSSSAQSGIQSLPLASTSGEERPPSVRTTPTRVPVSTSPPVIPAVNVGTSPSSVSLSPSAAAALSSPPRHPTRQRGRQNTILSTMTRSSLFTADGRPGVSQSVALEEEVLAEEEEHTLKRQKEEEKHRVSGWNRARLLRPILYMREPTQAAADEEAARAGL